MKKCRRSRRQFLACVSLGLALTVMPSCVSIRGTKSRGQPFTFVQLCDPQLGMGGYAHDMETLAQAVAQINLLNPAFVIICGDMVHDRNEESFADFKRIKAALEVPCYCVPGNHDVGGEPTQESLQQYREVIGADYDSFEYNGYVFALVNTQLWKAPVKGESEKHDAWLEKTLERAVATGSPVIVAGHYPLFLERPDEADEYMNLPLTKRMELLDLFERSGVVAMLGGHAHRLVINDYKGIQLVNGESTSKNFDQRPFGFRVWQVDGPSLRHEFVPLSL